jgi:hypothetical protein
MRARRPMPRPRRPNELRPTIHRPPAERPKWPQIRGTTAFRKVGGLLVYVEATACSCPARPIAARICRPATPRQTGAMRLGRQLRHELVKIRLTFYRREIFMMAEGLIGAPIQKAHTSSG